jgi:serine/threonine protein kinase
MDKMRVNGREYSVIRLLGKGKGGYSYLVRDEEGEYVLKQIHHEPCDYYQFGDKLASELRDYEHLLQIGVPMPKLLDVDKENERILKEYIPGQTIYHKILAGDSVEPYIQQMRLLCQKLYENGTNIDYFPTNFVPHTEILYYIDYECNGYMDQWNFENWGIGYWSRTPQLMQYAAEHHDL